jgi:Protein ChrB, N-terminal
VRWVVLVIRLPAGPSRHRVAVWRELRQLGALTLAPGVWAVPATPAFQPGLQRAEQLARRADGKVLVLDADPHDEATSTLLTAEFTAARQEEWAEFVADCDKYEAELAKEQRKGKLTLAELEEEEHSLERLRRWWRDLKARDAFSLPEASDAEQHLKRCEELLDDYADNVYRAVHQPLGETEGASDA